MLDLSVISSDYEAVLQSNNEQGDTDNNLPYQFEPETSETELENVQERSAFTYR